MDGTDQKRPLGIKLVAALYVLESIALVLAAIIGRINHELWLRADVFIAQRVPLIQLLGIANLGVTLAPLFAMVSVVLGMGVWFLKKWARTFILWDIMNRLGGGLCAAILLWSMDRQMLTSIVSAHYFIPGVFANIVILGYLFDPDVKRAFGMKDDEQENWWMGGPL
jgi:hypothetical protein